MVKRYYCNECGEVTLVEVAEDDKPNLLIYCENCGEAAGDVERTITPEDFGHELTLGKNPTLRIDIAPSDDSPEAAQ